MKEGRISHLKEKDRGQAIVEFVIALPILLFVLFGIIEFARMVFAWMAVQNAARFGIRYAVTGEYNEIYCVEAGNYLGAAHVNADTDGGDPQDCQIPDTYPGADKNDLERDLIDLARLFSIQDAAVGGGTGLWLRPNVSGNYEQYLNNHDEAFIGLPAEEGFYHVTTCSNRAATFAMDYSNFSIPLCVDLLNANQLMDDAGGPGDRVKVRVEHQHPLFLPLLTNLWPSVTLTAERDGIVEKFRTSRVIGVSGPILSAPTWTQTPTISPTPTITPTPTETSSATATLTPTITETPIPVDCDLITITDHDVVTNLFTVYAMVEIQNNNPVDVHLFRADQDWVKDFGLRQLWAFQFYTSPWSIVNDPNPPSVWIPGAPIAVPPGGVAQYLALWTPGLIPMGGNTSTDLEFDDGCHKIVAVNMPTPTPSDTPTQTATPTITPTPDCSAYSMSSFVFGNSALQSLTVSNGDVVDTVVNQIQFNWDYAEQLGDTNGFNSLAVDLFSWNGSNFHLGGNNDGIFDSSSPTNWIGGSLPFNHGSAYTWAIDFDGDWGGGGPLTGVINSDFGVIIDFANGCQLRRDPVPRAIITWTPSSTPTITWTPTPPPPPTATAIPSPTPLPSATPLPTFTRTPTWTPTITYTPSKTWTPSITPSKTNTPLTPTRTNTPVPSNTLPPTQTNTPAPTRTPTPTKSPTPTPIPTWTPACPFDDPGWPCQPTWTPTP